MPKFIDLAGQKFARLTVVALVSRGGPKVHWFCLCECGNRTVVTTGQLRKGGTKSCGCLKFQDLTGQRFGRYTVLEQRETITRGHARWLCQCECGTQKVVDARHLRDGSTVSCGCYAAEQVAIRSTIHGGAKRASRTSEHKVWTGMMARCHWDPDENYGGRGITVCERWRESFAAFLEDMGPRPAGRGQKRCDWSIDRIDVNGNYEPGNCRWATHREQMRNTRCNLVLEHMGKRLTATEWAEVTGLTRLAIYDRIRHGWDTERALTQPLRRTSRTRN